MAPWNDVVTNQTAAVIAYETSSLIDHNTVLQFNKFKNTNRASYFERMDITNLKNSPRAELNRFLQQWT